MEERLMESDELRIAAAQIRPLWMDRAATLRKVERYASDAAAQDCQMVCFGEAMVPGYPFWVERTDGARFESDIQKDLYAHYLDQGVVIERGDLAPLCELAADQRIAVVVGCMERAPDRGGHSLYASLVSILPDGQIGSVHRKLMPTYEERLVWSPGDGHGLRTHALGPFRLGGLNCWENWMPLARAALYAEGVDLLVAAWPGNRRNTEDITRFIAKESRSYVISVSGLFDATDVPANLPHADLITAGASAPFADGGSCIAGPDGCWVVEPVVGEETLVIAAIDHQQVRRERQNFDPAGHYGRPDVTELSLDRRRQRTVRVLDDSA
jgi:nitrilase